MDLVRRSCSGPVSVLNVKNGLRILMNMTLQLLDLVFVLGWNGAESFAGRYFSAP